MLQELTAKLRSPYDIDKAAGVEETDSYGKTEKLRSCRKSGKVASPRRSSTVSSERCILIGVAVLSLLSS